MQSNFILGMEDNVSKGFLKLYANSSPIDENKKEKKGLNSSLMLHVIDVNLNDILIEQHRIFTSIDCTFVSA